MSSYDDDLTEDEIAELEAAMVEERQREIAVEHLLFKTMEYVEQGRPGLLSCLESSLSHLGDRADDETKDDEEVRGIARRMIESARRQG